MRTRSQPIVLKPYRFRSGNAGFRLTGTVRGKRIDRKFADHEEAVEVQLQLEAERIHGSNAPRPKHTHLSIAEIREAEAAFGILNGTGLTLLELVRLGIKHPPVKRTEVTIKFAYAQFLEAIQESVSRPQYNDYRRRLKNFVAYFGSKTALSDITGEQLTAWLKSRNLEKKSWNNYRGNLSAFFNWSIERPRSWVTQNPVKEVVHFKQNVMRRPPRGRLSIESCKALMAFLEKEHPNWCCFFALCLFAGVRPDMRDGEMFELAQAIEQHGPDEFISNGVLHLTAGIAKTSEERATTIQPNLAAWLKKYPPTPKNVNPNDHKICAQIRARFEIPADGLRHTCISAFVARFGSFANAAVEFGNSEKMIRKHYFRRFSQEDGIAFYSIFPEGMDPSVATTP